MSCASLRPACASTVQSATSSHPHSPATWGRQTALHKDASFILPRRRALRVHAAAAGDSNSSLQTGSSRSILQAFFVGRAFAEVLNERLGSAASDLVAEVGMREAEFRRTLREFQDEVTQRAEADMLQNRGPLAPPSAAGGAAQAGSGIMPPPDLAEVVDDVRAEIASARASVVLYKNSFITGPQ